MSVGANAACVLASTSKTVDVMADDLMMMLRGLQASARRAPRLYRDLGHLTLHTRRMCIVAGRK